MSHIPNASLPNVHWYAVWTKSRHEKAAAARLEALGVAHYLPMRSEARQWSDRKQIVEAPLFPGYLFVHLDILSREKLEVLKTPGVAGFVGNSTGPLPIPGSQIDSVRKLVCSGKQVSSRPLLTEGDRVRVVSGPLLGMEGRLLRFGAQSHLVISIEMIQRSISVTVADDQVEPIVNPSPGYVNETPAIHAYAANQARQGAGL